MSDSSSRSSSPNPANNRPYMATRRRRSNADYGETLTTQLQSFGLYSVDVYQWKDDDLSFRSAAAQSRLPYDHLSKMELKFFSKVMKDQSSTMMYLFCRNKILVLWHLDPLVELTMTDILQEIPPPFNADVALISDIHLFLQRYGYINYGVFLNFTKSILTSRRRVIVIGGGASGLAAARQLQFFGFDVKILEGRPRIGGRVMSYPMEGHPVDLGAQIIMGINGNPMVTLAKQLPVRLIRIAQRCPVFDHHGKLVDPRKDDMIQTCFNKILETCAFIAHGQGITEIDGRKLSLGEAFDAILNQQELRVLEKRLTYFNKYNEIANTLRDLNKKLLLQRMTVEKCMAETRKSVNVESAQHEDVFVSYEKIQSNKAFENALRLRTLRTTLATAIEAYDDTEKQRKELERVFAEFKSMEPSQVYMNAGDKRVLDFHLANLEYGIGSSIYSASLKHWDHDDDFAFDGSHMMVGEGYCDLIRELARDLNFQRECVVKGVKYDETGVDVTYATQRKSEEPINVRTERVDAVVCTVPLGVLKTCVAGTKAGSSIQFEPPLPKWKRKAIMNLGYGSLNKLHCELNCFFGVYHHVLSLSHSNPLEVEAHREAPNSVARGELFMFFSNGQTPVLTGLLAGESASIIDKKREDYLVTKAMSVLRNIFGSACPKRPLNHVITLWHADQFSRGCYSYVGTNSSAEDYDTLAKPIGASSDGAIPRVFFAGEHTNREYTATVHGAFLSGIRVAAEIADTLIGPAVGGTSEGERVMLYPPAAPTERGDAKPPKKRKRAAKKSASVEII